MSLKCIDFVRCKRRSFVLGVSGLAANITGTVAFFLSRRFDNIRRGRLGGVRGILREFSRLEDATKYQVKNGHFDIECVAQYYQNARERLL
jgi:hypothetical protein